jgi:hypothetical protein
MCHASRSMQPYREAEEALPRQVRCCRSHWSRRGHAAVRGELWRTPPPLNERRFLSVFIVLDRAAPFKTVSSVMRPISSASHGDLASSARSPAEDTRPGESRPAPSARRSSPRHSDLRPRGIRRIRRAPARRRHRRSRSPSIPPAINSFRGIATSPSSANSWSRWEQG